MTSIRIQTADVEMGDDEDTFVEVPAKWIICSTCRGNGKHSHALGAITMEDRERDWDQDSWNDYMGGMYDRQCEVCEGDGKIAVIDRDCFMTERQKAAVKKQDEDDAIDDEIEAEHRAEIAFGC